MSIEATVTNTLSDLIRRSLTEMQSERTAPRLTSDASDELIKFHEERADTLRELRMNFENEMARQPNPGH